MRQIREGMARFSDGFMLIAMEDRMRHPRFRPLIVLLAAWLATASGVTAAAAETVADFYKGRTLNILVGLQSGTGFDIYARALARHLSRHIPGNPTIVVQNMPGASGVKAANYLFNKGAKDGTLIGTFPQSFVTEPLYGNKLARYDAKKFIWIGNMEQGTPMCGIATDAGVDTFEDLMAKQVIWGATGNTGPLGKAAQALNSLVGTKLKVIYGYKGSASVKLAIQKGEVKGICGLPYSTFRSFWSDLLDNGKMKLIVQLAGPTPPEMKEIPQLKNYLKTEEKKQIYNAIFATQAISRLFVAPPGVPADRAKALQTAFMATMADPEFLADANKTRIGITPISAEQVAVIVDKLYQTPPELVKKAFDATLRK